MPAPWAITEVGAAALGDPRRIRRLATLLSDLAARPGEGLPAACATPAATKAAYRFVANEAIAAAAIVDAHIAATTARVRGAPTILALQDTTALDFTAHPALAGTGPLSHPTRDGLWVHSVLAATPEGTPLGLLHQHTWARDPATIGQRRTRRQRPTAAKESQRWLDAQAATAAVVPPDTRVITVADREADIYDLFARPRPAGHDLLIRAAQNRCLAEEARYLWTAVTTAPVGEVVPVAVGRRADREPREAQLTLRWVPVTLLPPRNRPDRTALTPLPLVAILATEPVPPPGEPPIHWLLLTTLRVQTGKEALACVRWYAQRWLVERYHFALKSGCKIEEVQVRTADRLARLLAISAIVAWRLLWLTYLARADPEQPCTVALTPAEWPVLYVAIHHAADLPAHPPSLGQAVRWIARLGGFLDRRGDGDPGLKVLWRGLRRLEDLTVGWQLAHSGPPVGALTGLLGNG
jgi:Transposase DNA-binding/Transposase Tn5 dimerisation domain